MVNAAFALLVTLCSRVISMFAALLQPQFPTMFSSRSPTMWLTPPRRAMPSTPPLSCRVRRNRRRSTIDNSQSSRCVGCVGFASTVHRVPRRRHRASRVCACRKEGRSPSSCVARSSTIHRRRDASAVYRVPRRRDGRIGSWRRRFWFLLLLVVVV